MLGCATVDSKRGSLGGRPWREIAGGAFEEAVEGTGAKLSQDLNPPSVSPPKAFKNGVTGSRGVSGRAILEEPPSLDLGDAVKEAAEMECEEEAM